MLFRIKFFKKKQISLLFSNSNYFFFKLKNLIVFRINEILMWFLDDTVFFLQIKISKISFLFFTFFAKYMNKIVRLRLASCKVFADSDLEMQGLGFEIYRITKRIYRFFCGFVNYIYIIVPKDIEILNSVRKKKKLLIRGYDKHIVKTFVNMLKLLKGFNAYRAVGFFEPRVLIRLRSGKKK